MDIDVASRRKTLEGIHVIVVDDSEYTREILRDLLQSCGARVSVAASADEALGLLEVVRPSALLTDITMPHHDGYWLLEQARKRPRGASLPIVAMTGHSEDDARQADSKSFDAYLTKPFNMTKLCRLLQDALSRGGPRYGPPHPPDVRSAAGDPGRSSGS